LSPPDSAGNEPSVGTAAEPVPSWSTAESLKKPESPVGIAATACVNPAKQSAPRNSPGSCGRTSKAKRARFITISLKHRDVPLKDQIRRLRQCFNRFKRTKFWREHVYGGVAILEVKREKKGWRERPDGTKYQTSGLWHPHLHMITTGTWMDQRTASQRWLKITGDSDRFDIRVVDREESASHYVSKYVTKSCNAEVVNNPEWLAELVGAMHRSRTYNVFGNWVGVDRDAPTDEASDWKPITTVHDLLQARDRGEEWARGLCRQLFHEPSEPKEASNAPKRREMG
jgi:hypothetical protein